MFEGLSAFPLTPADAAGRVIAEDLTRLLKRLVDAKVDSIGLLGSTGTYAYLTRQERRRALEIAVREVAGRVPVMVGVGAMRTDEAEALARDAKAAGADALLLAPVSYTPLTQDEVFELFRAVAAATDLPICIYNNPSTTHFSFGDPLLARLAGIETIRAVKMPLPQGGDFSGELRRLRDAGAGGLKTGYSGDWGAGAALLAGASAWYSVVGGLLPRATRALTTAARAGDKAEAERVDAAFAPLWNLFKEFGSIRVVYTAARLIELTHALPPRPLMALGDEHSGRLRAALSALAEFGDFG
jgi:4-hydroxy-tetrahydrodipicolinate synthase